MYIGIDLGGTAIKAGLVDENYKIINSGSVPTLANRHYTEIIADMAQLAIKITKEAGYNIEKDVKSIGIGSPGQCDSVNGVVLSSCNINFENTPICKEMQKHINKDILDLFCSEILISLLTKSICANLSTSF